MPLYINRITGANLLKMTMMDANLSAVDWDHLALA